MADFLDQKRDEIAARLAELRPLVEEHARLEAALAALDGALPPSPAPASATRPRARAVAAAPARAPAPARAGGRRRKARPASAGRRGRPKGSGERGGQVLAIVTASPGIHIPAIAEQLGIKPNYLYTLLRGMAADGAVQKRDDRGWYPT